MNSKPLEAWLGGKDIYIHNLRICRYLYTSSTEEGEDKTCLKEFTLATGKGVGEGELGPTLG